MKLPPRLVPLLLATAALLLSAGCYTVPETGRKALNLIPADQEMKLGLASFEEMKKNQKISTDPARNARLQRTGARIAAIAGPSMPGAQWEFVVFDDDATVNAFALPGGKVGVYTGLLNLASDDDELATVVGHEIAHVVARHGAERMSQSMIAAGIGVVLSEGVLRDDKNKELWMAAYGAAATLGVILPYSRLDENEADHIGMIYAAKSGYRPEAAVSFWRKMAAAAEGKQRPPQFLSTHPSDETRIRNLEAMVPQVMPYYEAAAKGQHAEGLKY